MEIDILHLLLFVVSANYIGSVGINESLLENNKLTCLFTYYRGYRLFFWFIRLIAYCIIWYLFVLYYKFYWISYGLILIIANWYNISWLLRSFFKDFVYILFYMYPFFIAWFFYLLCYPTDSIVAIPIWIIATFTIVVFIIQWLLDAKYLERQVEQYIDIDYWRSNFLEENKQKEMINWILSRDPYYSESQIISALKNVLVKK
jgi:hypothetical protein